MFYRRCSVDTSYRPEQSPGAPLPGQRLPPQLQGLEVIKGSCVRGWDDSSYLQQGRSMSMFEQLDMAVPASASCVLVLGRTWIRGLERRE